VDDDDGIANDVGGWQVWLQSSAKAIVESSMVAAADSDGRREQEVIANKYPL